TFLLADLGDASAEAAGLADVGIGVGRDNGDRHRIGFRQRFAEGLRLAGQGGGGERKQQHGQQQRGLAHGNLRLLRIGRGSRIRTDDPLPPRQMRYQAALYPDVGADYTPEQPGMARLYRRRSRRTSSSSIRTWR